MGRLLLCSTAGLVELNRYFEPSTLSFVLRDLRKRFDLQSTKLKVQSSKLNFVKSCLRWFLSFHPTRNDHDRDVQSCR